ncbi:MAG TPA: TolC family protein [Longimicrobiales bacterium]|nr:TolC family protein [Longimicrobiales bacterium]
MRTRSGVVAVLAVLAFAVAVPAEGQEVPRTEAVDTVSLEEAVARALDTSPQVVQAERGLGSAGFGTKQAYASLLPNLSLSTGASLSSSDRFDQTTGLWVSNQSDSYNAGLSASMDVFSGGRNLAAVRSARATVEAAGATLVTRRFAVALEAKRAFFAVLRAEDLIRLNQERIAQAREQLQAAERRLQAGRATRSDALRAQLQLSNARQALLNAETQRRTAMYALGQLVGVAGPVAAAPPATLAPETLALTPAEMRELVRAAAPAVIASDATLGVAEAALSQARAQYFPSVGVSGGYNWSNTEFGLNQGRTSWNTRVNLSYPLFNGLQREVSVDRAHAQLEVAEAEAAEARRAALAGLERLMAALELAALELVILDESVAVAEEDYRVQRERYEHGAATILELVSSQIARMQAEHDLINARYDYQIAKAELESLLGREL